jgi:hypothetical protein
MNTLYEASSKTVHFHPHPATSIAFGTGMGSCGLSTRTRSPLGSCGTCRRVLAGTTLPPYCGASPNRGREPTVPVGGVVRLVPRRLLPRGTRGRIFFPGARFYGNWLLPYLLKIVLSNPYCLLRAALQFSAVLFDMSEEVVCSIFLGKLYGDMMLDLSDSSFSRIVLLCLI